MFIGFVALAIWLMPKLWRALKNLYQRIISFFGGDENNTRTDMSERRSETLKSLFHSASNADHGSHK
jgi:hypothetical protein